MFRCYGHLEIILAVSLPTCLIMLYVRATGVQIYLLPNGKPFMNDHCRALETQNPAYLYAKFCCGTRNYLASDSLACFFSDWHAYKTTTVRKIKDVISLRQKLPT